MASQYVRLLDPRSFAANAVQDVERAVDLGAYTQMNIHIRRLSDQPLGGTLTIQHAAVNEESAYLDLTTTSLDTSSSDELFVQVTAFLRFVRWKLTSMNGTVILMVDIVAKE